MTEAASEAGGTSGALPPKEGDISTTDKTTINKEQETEIPGAGSDAIHDPEKPHGKEKDGSDSSPEDGPKKEVKGNDGGGKKDEEEKSVAEEENVISVLPVKNKPEEAYQEPGRPFRRFKESLSEYHKRLWKVEVERTDMVAWRKRDLWLSPTYPLPIIEVFYHRKPDDSSQPPDAANTTESVANEANEDTDELFRRSKNVHRIAIHSEQIIEELDMILGVSTIRYPLAISPPYKYLVCTYPGIPARLAKLREEIEVANGKIDEKKSQLPKEVVENESADKTSEDSPISPKTDVKEPSLVAPKGDEGSDDDSASESDSAPDIKIKDQIKAETEQRDLLEDRYSHLKLLYDFVSKELAFVFEFRKKIVEGTLTKIRFDDLWHLFMPGERIFSDENGFKQLYTVYSVTGGLPLLRRPNAQEITYMDQLRDKVRYWAPPPAPFEKDEEEHIEQLLRGESPSKDSWTPLKIDCYYVAFDGEYCGPVDQSRKIAPYTGEIDIVDLPFFPLRFHPEHQILLRDLESRGRKVLFSSGHKSYEGYTLAMKRTDSRVEVQSDVYIDFQAYYNDVPDKKPRVGRLLRTRQDFALVEESSYQFFIPLSGHEIDTMLSDEYLTKNRKSLERVKPVEDKLDAEYLRLLPHYALGYIFQLRRWEYLDIDLVKDIDQESAEARAAGFNDLVIPKRYRDLLVALVDSHVSGLDRGKAKSKKTPTQVDLVRGKGQGLIVLLHGPPGSGKTSTAETIAAYTRRPLYSITCGDLGTQAVLVEANLLTHTKRADRWGCVLLLDEADVFLARRDWNNMERNALVSIFLRQLEYYGGILFLTTNRLGGIDEAFKSRIHISLRYPSIDLTSTRQMWTNIMKRLEKDNKETDVKVLFDEESLLEFAQTHFEKCKKEGVTWNGRQIRNAFQTALALGHYDRLSKIKEAGLTVEEAMASGKKKWRSVKLTKANFQKVARTSKEFEEYIAAVRGQDDKNAIDDELRRDDYDAERPKARKSYSKAQKGKKAVRKEQVSSEDEEDEDEDEQDSEELGDEDDDDSD
ncbi:unnamed protein product [Periconia digitata]|uniref:AAA+ ATPase domain-containing protein n=1 Tax=Periconia digitata TaxID=1303443 RepID=A0A9W4XKG8_9PLEO|nr:unnamed protein product [Periconia digitata]